VEAEERALGLLAGLPAMESGGAPTREPSAEVAG
jgi:hypothetical protein